MGTNRRYAAHYDRVMDEKIAQSVASRGGLQTLKPEELQLDRDAVTIDPNPKPVRAWVRFYDSPLLVQAEACRWTSRAVGIRFRIGGAEYKTWVWANAVEDENRHRPTPMDEKYPTSS